MTSLFDVLFILVFVSIINAAMSRQDVEDLKAAVASQPTASASASASPMAAPLPPSAQALRAQAVADIDARPAIVARVTDKGVLRSVEAGQKQVKLDLPLIEQVPDQDQRIAYLGDRSSNLRICALAQLHLGLTDLSPYLVIITSDVPLSDLTQTLVVGMQRDAFRCVEEQRAIGIVVDPVKAAPPVPSSSSAVPPGTNSPGAPPP